VPARRLFSLTRRIIEEALAFGEEETRESFQACMEWEEVVDEKLAIRQDQSARHSALLIGSGNVDEMVMRTLEAQARQREQEEADRAAGKATPIS
jgi:hypothetical protein